VGAVNIKMLSLDEPASKFMSPAEAITARNIKISVKDLLREDPDELKPFAGVQLIHNQVTLANNK